MFWYDFKRDDGCINFWVENPSEEVIKEMNLIHQTDEEIVYFKDGKGYLKSECPLYTEDEFNEQVRGWKEMQFSKRSDPLKLQYEENLARYGYDDEGTKSSLITWLDMKDLIRKEAENLTVDDIFFIKN